MTKFKELRLLTSVAYTLPQHQTLLSFNDDDANEAFKEWWEELGGAEQFNIWLKEQDEFKHLAEE